jgi:hypothetical protein
VKSNKSENLLLFGTGQYAKGKTGLEAHGQSGKERPAEPDLF